ncbi:MAG: hypothetical protein IT383_15280 [Deltaproteobacteria bacterium]|nr:hypothetical protein [Deltaproteobacteria bacterium]
MTDGPIVLKGPRLARALRRLAAALLASRANASFFDVRSAAGHLAHAQDEVAFDHSTGLPTYESWARLRADWQLAHEAASNERQQALRGLPAPRLGDLEVSVRSADKRSRRLHAALDKVAANGRLLRLRVDLTLDRRVDDSELLDLLFPAADLPAELLLLRVANSGGVREVERVSICAVDAFVDIESSNEPALAPLALSLAAPGAVALSLSTQLCAVDVTPGDNDLLGDEPSPDARAVRARLGTVALPQRLYRDRKLVVNAVAAPLMAEHARARGAQTVFYRVETP